MNFRLVWPRYVNDLLGAAYLEAREAGLASEFTAATHRLERLLTSDPLSAGESREGPDRIAIDWRVVMWFRVDEPNRAVVVTGIHFAR